MEENFVITAIDRIIFVGKNEYPAKSDSFSRNLPHNELIFHFSGHSTLFFGDDVLDRCPDTVEFLPQGKNKRYDVLRHESGECIDVFFDTDVPIAQNALIFKMSQSEKIASLFKKIFATWVSKKEGYYFESVSLLYRIFAEMQKDTSVPKQHKSKIAPAMEMIHDEFMIRDFSLCELATACGMGESYFQKLFKEIHGISPKKYIIQLKINHACDLLRLERYTVTQIAELCNFSDIYFFSRQFKEYMGITPTQFIEKYRSSK